jgi:hypothetical protein
MRKLTNITAYSPSGLTVLRIATLGVEVAVVLALWLLVDTGELLIGDVERGEVTLDAIGDVIEVEDTGNEVSMVTVPEIEVAVEDGGVRSVVLVAVLWKSPGGPVSASLNIYKPSILWSTRGNYASWSFGYI